MGPADSVKVSRDSTYSGYFRRLCDFAYGTFALYGAAVPCGFRYRSVFLLRMKVLQPRSENPSGLGSSAFARRYLRNRIFLSIPPGTEMFQFSGLAARAYVFNARLFGNLRIKACLTAPRSFSQFSAPFKAFRRQDVPHALFLRLIAPIHHSCSERSNRPVLCFVVIL